MNTVTIVGRLGRDVEDDGSDWLFLSVATQAGKDKDPDWHRVGLDGAKYEKLLPYLKKGQMVAITGRISYDDERKATIWLNTIELVGGSPNTNETKGGGGRARNAPKSRSRNQSHGGEGLPLRGSRKRSSDDRVSPVTQNDNLEGFGSDDIPF